MRYIRLALMVLFSFFIRTFNSYAYDLLDYFPLTPGSYWVFPDERREIQSNEPVNGHDAVKLVYDWDDGKDHFVTYYDDNYIYFSEYYLYNWDDGMQPGRYQYTPVRKIKRHMNIGETFSDSCRLYFPNGTSVPFNMTYTLTKIENINTSAGYFSGCLRLEIYKDGDTQPEWWAPGVGQVKYCDEDGCFSVTSYHVVGVQANQNPIINSFTATPTTGTAPLSVTFNCSAADPDGGSIAEFRWDIDNNGTIDGTTATGSFSYTYNHVGTYQAKCTVVDDEGATTASEVKSITVDSQQGISINRPFYFDKTSSIEDVDIRDLDNDNRDEIVVVLRYKDRNSSKIVIYRIINESLELYWESREFDGYGYGIEIYDINQDGFADILLCCSGLQAFINDSNGSFQHEEIILSTPDDVFAIADLNNDNHKDIAFGGPGSNSGLPRVFSGASNLTFSEISELGGIAGSNAVQAMDANGDSLIDLLVTELYSATAYLHINNGNFTFTSQLIHSASENQRYWNCSTADFNNDGLDEFVIPEIWGDLLVFKNTGNGNFDVTFRGHGNGVDTEIHDVNNDNLLDIIQSPFSDNGEIYLIVNKGNFSFEEKKLVVTDPIPSDLSGYNISGAKPYGLGVGDINVDSIPDLVVGKNYSYYINDKFHADHGMIHIILGIAERFGIAYQGNEQPQTQKPVISNFTATPISGAVPLLVRFNCDAYDPDGGSINEYRLDVNNDGIVDYTTSNGSFEFNFNISGNYQAKCTVVDDENETTTSSIVTITVNTPIAYIEGNYNYYLPYFKSGNGFWSGLGLTNRNHGESTQLQISVYNSGGISLAAEYKTIPAHGQDSFVVATQLNNSGWMQVNSHQPMSGLAFLGSWDIPLLMADIPFTSELSSCLVVPHISQDVSWDTTILICNPNNEAVSVGLKYVDKAGAEQGIQNYTIPAHGCGEYLLSTVFSDKIPMAGSVEINSSNGIAAFALYTDKKSGGTYYAGINAESCE